MKYRTIVADPPWPIGNFVRWTDGRVFQRPYETMTAAEIRALPIGDFAATRAHLYLWTINEWLEEAFSVARAWGFEPSVTLTWCKPDRPGRYGGAFPANTEFVLYCTRDWKDERVLAVCRFLADRAATLGVSRREIDVACGTSDMAGWWLSDLQHRCACPSTSHWERLRSILQFGDEMDDLVASINAEKGQRFAIGAAPGRWFQWPTSIHSRKPDAFLDLVEQVSPGPYLELFARRQRLGWDTWGNEALQHVEMAS